MAARSVLGRSIAKCRGWACTTLSLGIEIKEKPTGLDLGSAREQGRGVNALCFLFGGVLVSLCVCLPFAYYPPVAFFNVQLSALIFDEDCVSFTIQLLYWPGRQSMQ